ncbi:helix-turn-helix domain-containing protein [Psychrobacter sp. H7-1]|uniref:helix-turn-helix domain-containing protein n=1 Tax=Psychrobacter sp. H7-1 TaxID=1569265 RepID=UPI0019192BE8|nr:helix-turn-helix domain-containing protein [Psychrobacter sp. H7-1]
MTQKRQTPKRTYCETIKAHLLAGKSISTWQAYQLYNITCLAQRIHDLRNKGLPIDDEIVEVDGKRFKLYWLNTGYMNGQLKPLKNSMKGV